MKIKARRIIAWLALWRIIMKITLLPLMLFIFSQNVAANIVITGTRVIYPEGANSMAIQLTNNGKDSALVQSWTDSGDFNSTPENANTPFYISPPIVKINGLQGQQLNLKKMDNLGKKLPENIESVFYLNVLDIPKTADEAIGKNAIKLATRSRIKIFYRPNSLTLSPENITDKLSYKLSSNNIVIKNDSPYHLTVASITTKENKNKSLVESEMIPPLSTKELPLNSKLNSHDLLMNYVDDYGVFKAKSIRL